MSDGVKVLTELLQLGPWAVIVGVVVWLVRCRELRPFRRLVVANLFDRLLKSRGVDQSRRHDVLVAAAMKAQNLSGEDVWSPPGPSADPSPPRQAPALKAVPPA